MPSSKKGAAAPRFDEWIALESVPRPKRTPAWHSWPKAVVDEVAEVLKRNDAGTARVTERAMRQRITEVHRIPVTPSHMEHFLYSLGRRGWGK